jgi:hypothetical protein
MLDFSKVAGDPGFEAFVRVYNLPAFVPLKRVCEVGGFGRTKLYELNSTKKLVIRDLEGKRGVHAAELYWFLSGAPAAEGRPAVVYAAR